MWNNIYAFLLISLPVIWEAYQDTRDFRKGRRDKRWWDLVIRFGAIVPLGYVAGLLTGQTIWQAIILCAGIFVMFFDFYMGWVVKRNIFYLGETSIWDKIAEYMGPPWAQIIARGIIFASCMTAYYDLDKIISKHYF